MCEAEGRAVSRPGEGEVCWGGGGGWWNVDWEEQEVKQERGAEFRLWRTLKFVLRKLGCYSKSNEKSLKGLKWASCKANFIW